MTPADLVNSLIGLPWSLGGQGPDTFDCWGLCRYVQRQLFGRELPIVRVGTDDALTIARTIRHHHARSSWTPVPAPVHGAIVEMSHASTPHHVGVWLQLDEGGVLHAARSGGVLFDSPAKLTAGGWRCLTWYDHAA
jgi:cell wall-associated NlpC family hydrolase